MTAAVADRGCGEFVLVREGPVEARAEVAEEEGRGLLLPMEVLM